MAAAKDPSLFAPTVRDPEVESAIALLDKAADALRGADLAMAREIRSRADATAVLASRKRADDVYRKAVEVRLKAEAHMGHEAGRAEAGRPKNVPSGDVSSVPMSSADRNDLMRCRKVAAASPYLGAYLEHVRASGEDPTRAGLLSFADAQEKAKADARAEDDARRKRAMSQAPNGKPVIDVGAVVKQGAMSDAGSKVPPPKGAPPRSSEPMPVRPAGALAPRWYAAVRACIGAIENAPPPKGWFDDRYRAVLQALGEIEEECESLVTDEVEALTRGKAS